MKTTLVATLVSAVLLLAPQAALAEWAITQLTDNSQDDYNPDISGSNVVWMNGPKLLLFDGSAVTQLASSIRCPDEYTLPDPSISGENVVVTVYRAYWDQHILKGDTDILLLEGNTGYKVFDGLHIGMRMDGPWDCEPQISGSNVTWMVYDGNDYDVFLYDGSSVTQISDSSYDDWYPQISGTNVVWLGYDGNGNDSEIFFFDGSTTSQLTNNSVREGWPQISESYVAWSQFDGNDYEVMLFDGTSIKQLTDNSISEGTLQISGECVAWSGFDGNDSEIFLYDGRTITQITDNEYNDDYLKISGSNIVWYGSNGEDHEVFVYDGSTVTQLTCNNAAERNIGISGTNVVWQADDGHDDEIYMATWVPEPSAFVLVALSSVVFLANKRRLDMAFGQLGMQ